MSAPEAILDAGFVYWGLFLAFGAIVVAYLVWMWRSEAPGPDRPGPGRDRSGADPPPAGEGRERETPGP